MRLTCPDCHQECNAILVDNGIGPYEFWGAKGWDSRPEVVSDCCHAELELSPWELEEDFHV